MKKWKNIFCANENKKAGAAILITDKTEFKTKTVARSRERDYIIKGTRGITTLSIYAPNTGTPKYIKQLFTDIK